MVGKRTAASDSRTGRRVTLRDLQILLAVAQFGSMAKAAFHLSITQPAVSQAVANLEGAFGARLIDRGPHGALLTSYGEAIQRRGMEVFDVLKQGLRDIEYLSDASSGDVWIGANEVLLGGFVPAVVQRLAEQHSNIAVHALTVNTSHFDFVKLRERKLDLLLGRIMPQIDDDLNVETLFEEGLSVVVGQSSPVQGIPRPWYGRSAGRHCLGIDALAAGASRHRSIRLDDSKFICPVWRRPVFARDIAD
jgi:DNA-binding transcriptional LysR family regulator